VRTGLVISGIGHLALILWLVFGGLRPHFTEARLAVADVALLSEEDFVALAETVPDPAFPDDPEATVIDDTPPSQELPASPELADVPTPMEAPAPPEALEVQEIPPVLSEETAPARADRVASEPVPLPQPDTRIAEVPQTALTPDEDVSANEEAHEAAAVEAAAAEIVTEAEATEDSGLRSSPRPPPRLARPERPKTAEEPEPELASDPFADAIEDALSQANDPPETRPASGPPLTRAEREGLRLAVQNCWNVDVGSEAANVTIVIGVSMGRDGKVAGDSLQLLSSEGGSVGAVEIAFEAARRAILRCQRDGYELPAEKYDHWKEIEITFNPENMRTR